MKRFIVSILLIVICFLLQTTVFKGLAFGGIVPNLLIVLTASFGFMRGESTGLLIGFFSGILADIFFRNMLGDRKSTRLNSSHTLISYDVF